MGKIDDMLLRKVAELTLYVIEQNKNLEQLLEKINELEKIMNLIRQELNC